MLNNYTWRKIRSCSASKWLKIFGLANSWTLRSAVQSRSRPRIFHAYCYIVCDITDSLKRVLKTFQAFITPDNQGYYGFHPQYAAYYEVMDYNKLLRDAKQRNKIFFDSLLHLTGYDLPLEQIKQFR